MVRLTRVFVFRTLHARPAASVLIVLLCNFLDEACSSVILPSLLKRAFGLLLFFSRGSRYGCCEVVYVSANSAFVGKGVRCSRQYVVIWLLGEISMVPMCPPLFGIRTTGREIKGNVA